MKTLTFSQSDLIDALRLNYLQLFRSKKDKKILTVIVISFVLCFMLVWFQNFPISGLGALIFFIIIPLLVAANWFAVIPRTAKSLIKTPQFSMPLNIHWDEHYLYSSNADIKVRSAWHAFLKIAEDDSCILLYSQSCLFHIYPKRFFESEEELQDFKSHALKGIADYHLSNSK